MMYNALLENNCSEQASRMSAMESSTKNATEMLSKLTLTYNRCSPPPPGALCGSPCPGSLTLQRAAFPAAVHGPIRHCAAPLASSAVA